MTKMLKRRGSLLAAAAALLLAGGCDAGGRGGGIAVKDAWVRMPASKSQPGAAYFRIEGGEEGTKLLGLSSPLVRWVELHETIEKDGRTRMRETKEVEFPSRGALEFKPGGRHVMLRGMSDEIAPGGTVPLTFAFNNAPPVTVDAPVRAAGDEAPHEGH